MMREKVFELFIRVIPSPRISFAYNIELNVGDGWGVYTFHRNILIIILVPHILWNAPLPTEVPIESFGLKNFFVSITYFSKPKSLFEKKIL